VHAAGNSNASLLIWRHFGGFTSCPECGVVFALPMEIFLIRCSERGTIYCPHGHLIELAPRDEGSVIDLLGELRQIKHELATALHTLARIPQPNTGPIRDDEFERRVRILTNRSEKVGLMERPRCCLCAKTSTSNYNLRRHLKRRHDQEIRELADSYFN